MTDSEDLYSILVYLIFGAYPEGPLGGFALTVIITLVSTFFSALIGLAGGIGLTMTRGYTAVALQMLIGLFRAIPVLMLIFWTFFLIPALLGVDVPSLACVIPALSLIGGAYLSHAVRAGILAIGQGQWQAAEALGLSPAQALRYVVLPQALRVMAPSFVNQWVSLAKDTSLAYIVGVPEFTFLANQVNSRLMVYPVQIFLFVGLMYLCLCTFLQVVAGLLLRSQFAAPEDET